MTRLIAALATLALAAGLAACGSSDNNDKGTSSSGGGNANAQTIRSNPANKNVSVTIGSKNFTEEFILGEIYAQALQAAGYEVKKDLNLGSEQIALKALKNGDIDAYPEYTSTALTSFFKVQPQDIPKDPEQAVTNAQDDFAKAGLVAFPPTP
ncbi:MAG: glycine betaine ABC transporter substrate-binding protein, partial [Solirubrobacterales bacterium]